MSYESCKQLILKKYPVSKVIGAFKIPSGYIFSLKPKSWKDDEYVLDGFFKVTTDGKISEYSPVRDPEEFKLAMKNVIE